MLRISAADVVASPFPHVVKQDILPPDLFAALRADFPDASHFEDQKGESGTSGSRTGSGFDIYRGDSSYATLLSRSAAWREFDGFINSEAFADLYREVFAAHTADIGLRVDLDRSHIDPGYVEPREVMTEHATPMDRVHGVLNKLTGPFISPKPTELFTRLDIHKSLSGYRKRAHCDRPNRLASLIVYFTDADAVGLEGGELQIFRHKAEKPVRAYERHPKADDVEIVAQLRPKANLGVFFPCQNNSYHGVTAVTSEGIARDFLYINISGRAANLW